MILVKCPICYEEYNLPDDYLGAKVACEKCETRFKIITSQGDVEYLYQKTSETKSPESDSCVNPVRLPKKLIIFFISLCVLIVILLSVLIIVLLGGNKANSIFEIMGSSTELIGNKKNRAEWKKVHPQVKVLLKGIADASSYYQNSPHKLLEVLNSTRTSWEQLKSKNDFPEDYVTAVENYISFVDNLAKLLSLRDFMTQEQCLVAGTAALAGGAKLGRDLRDVATKYGLESWGKGVEY